MLRSEKTQHGTLEELQRVLRAIIRAFEEFGIFHRNATSLLVDALAAHGLVQALPQIAHWINAIQGWLVIAHDKRRARNAQRAKDRTVTGFIDACVDQHMRDCKAATIGRAEVQTQAVFHNRRTYHPGVSQRKSKVLVAMSGGVDSSVAAALLLRQGYEVVGCFMRLGSPGETFDELMENGEAASDDRREEDGGRADITCSSRTIRIGHQGCCSINDAADARLVAAKLGIPFYVVNFRKDFGRIIDYFVGEYNAGRTPNPCVRCNDWLKFGRLHEYAKQIDAEFVASGHYARIEHAKPTDGHPWALPRLLRGIDHTKDQSYVLFGAPRARLAEMLLPIGGYQKSKVREVAREFGLPVFDKPDSQEICFVPDNDYAGLVRQRTPQAMTRGRIVDTSGKTLGEHEGQQHFTVGQRKGVGLALGDRVYVVSKDAATNTVVVGDREELRCEGLIARETNWLIDLPTLTNDAQRAGPSSAPSDIGRPSAWLPCTAKIRYNAPPVEAEVRRIEGIGEDELEVRFASPQYAVAPGQAVVCYQGEAVICGGWIATAR